MYIFYEEEVRLIKHFLIGVCFGIVCTSALRYWLRIFHDERLRRKALQLKDRILQDYGKRDKDPYNKC
jgi:hypothetical protein